MQDEDRRMIIMPQSNYRGRRDRDAVSESRIYSSAVWEAEVDEDSDDDLSIGNRNLIRLNSLHRNMHRNNLGGGP